MGEEQWGTTVVPVVEWHEFGVAYVKKWGESWGGSCRGVRERLV